MSYCTGRNISASVTKTLPLPNDKSTQGKPCSRHMYALRTYFYTNGFARRLVLKQRYRELGNVLLYRSEHFWKCPKDSWRQLQYQGNLATQIPDTKQKTFSVFPQSYDNTSEVWGNEKCCGKKHEPQPSISTAISSSPKLSRVSVTITLWKHRENVFYCLYGIKARSNFPCYHTVIVNGFEPIRARVVITY